MDGDSQRLWFIIFIFFLMAAYFALAETSFASVSKIRIKAAAEHGSKKARDALQVLENFDRAVTTILIGTNITHLGIASIVTVLVIRLWGSKMVSVSTLVTTIAVFFLSEMLPKTIAKRYCDTLAPLIARSLLFFMRIFRPVAFLLTIIGQGAARLLGQAGEVTVTEEELHGMIENMADDGVLAEEQSELMASALDFGNITVESILTPCSSIDAISVLTPPEKVVTFLLSHKHSRYPVYENSLNHIIGTLQMRKYLKVWQTNKEPDLRTLIDSPLFIKQGETVSELIHEMNREKVSLAIVLDEACNTAGVVTIEDALGALVGDVWGGETA